MTSALVQAAVAAASAGSACSVCGASASSAFLSSYIITHKKLAGPVLCFLLGKTAVIATLCILSACLGEKILDESGLAGRLDVYLIAQILVLLIAVVLAARWIYYERKDKGACHGAGRCGAGARPHESSCGSIVLFANGVACGATPCAPLLVVLSQAAATTQLQAAVSGVVFSVTGFLSPVILWLAVSRLLAGQMQREIAQWIKWFQFACYILLALLSIYTMIRYRL